jgi:glycosyltransferase A (GT-A) superfamily protein (DUF2064 family)
VALMSWMFPRRPVEHSGATFCLLVVAKAPVPGLAKTRLTPPADPEQAAAIAAAALLDTLAAAAATPGAVPVVAMTGDLRKAAEGAALAEALRTVTVLPQRGNGFGARLAHAHADAHAVCPTLPVVQIGMDTPQAGPELFAGIAALLDDADSVLCPAEDGGWWALGLRDPRRAAVLRDVPMSRGDTATRTLDALATSGTTTRIGLTLSDVDTWGDACRVAEAVPDGRFAAAVRAVAGAGSRSGQWA